MSDNYVNPYTGTNSPYVYPPQPAPFDPFNSWTVQSEWSLPTGDPVAPLNETAVSEAAAQDKSPAVVDAADNGPDTVFNNAVDGSSNTAPDVGQSAP